VIGGVVGWLILIVGYAQLTGFDRSTILQGDVCGRAEALYAQTGTFDQGTPSGTFDLEEIRSLLPAHVEGVSGPTDEQLIASVPLVDVDAHQAEMRAHLQQNHFRLGFERGWYGSEHAVLMTVQIFEEPDDAAAYHRWISTSFTCRFSNEVFEGPVEGSIGFQIRWADGDVSEQIAFVRGPLRYVVSLRGAPPPPDRGAVVNLAEQLSTHISSR
jgi:hypothetical protein